MKKIIVLLLVIFASLGAEIKQESQRFKVTYTITYNSITLAQADSLEKAVKSKFKSACGVNIGIEPVSSGSLIINGSIGIGSITQDSVYMPPNINQIIPNKWMFDSINLNVGGKDGK